MISPLRTAAVAGRFYPRNPEMLRRDVANYFGTATAKIPALGCVVPHAGYIYSGHVAGAVLGRIEIPLRIVILCPNHTGFGPALSIMSEGEWETPLGRVPIDSELASALKQHCPRLEEDRDAHRAEHAIEVELPFLQTQRADFRFVPIVVGTSRYALLSELGNALGDVIARQREPVLILASSDMNHYEDDSLTRQKDSHAIQRLLELDPRGLHDVIRKENITMCGFGPAIVMLEATKKLGAKSAQLIKYATSGEVSGDFDQVVGYAGIAVT